MKIPVYKFFAEEGLTDHEKLFFWFMTKVLIDGGPSTSYTIANFDIKVLLKGSVDNANYTKESLPDSVNKWFDIYFVTTPRNIIKLNDEALKHFQKFGDVIRCGKVEVKITDPKVQRLYTYLLGLFAGSNSLYYDEKCFGIGDIPNNRYNHESKNLSKLELSTLLNGA